MTSVMFILFLSAIGSVYSEVSITVQPSMDEGFITWSQTVTISCNWTPPESGRLPQADILADGTSVFSDEMYSDDVNQEDESLRVYFADSADQGEASLVLKDVKATDSRAFSCSVSRIGTSATLGLNILEPPLLGVSEITSVPDFTSVALSWEAVEGATLYEVKIQPVGAADWTTVETADTTATFNDLTVATVHNVEVIAKNAAGVREGILPAASSFETLDNRPPQPVDDLEVTEGKYNETSISLGWSLASNLAENRIITEIVAAVVDNLDVEAAAPQTLAPDATSVTFELNPGHAEYTFMISTVNEFSEGVDTGRTISHVIAETTKKPTTPPPTTTPEPTTPEPTTPQPTTTPPPPPVEVDCGDTTTFENVEGTPISLTCTVKNGGPDEIAWTFSVGEGGVSMTEEELVNSGLVVTRNNETSTTTLQIEALQEGNASYSCKSADPAAFCIFEVIVHPKPEPEPEPEAEPVPEAEGSSTIRVIFVPYLLSLITILALF